MSELIRDIDPGKLPPRTRAIYSEIGTAITRGWRPSELAEKLGVAPSWLSVCIGELRTALGLLNGVFPTLSEEEYDALRESIARRGVEVPIVVDEQGVIDGHARVAALHDLAEICDLVDAYPNWSDISSMGQEDAVEMYGRDTWDAVNRLADYGPLVVEALERRWEEPPVDRREGLSFEERRRLAITLNSGRRQLERGDLRLLVEVELMVDPDRTNREIGALVGCSGQWVGQVRAQLAEEERLLANPQAAVESESTFTLRRVAELVCPHCAHDLVVLRAGRDFQLEELAAGEG